MLSYAVVANTAHLQMLRRPITQAYILRHYETPAMPAPTWRSPPSPAAWPHRCRPTSGCESWRMSTDAWSPQSTDLTTEVDSQGCTSAGTLRSAQQHPSGATAGQRETPAWWIFSPAPISVLSWEGNKLTFTGLSLTHPSGGTQPSWLTLA